MAGIALETLCPRPGRKLTRLCSRILARAFFRPRTYRTAMVTQTCEMHPYGERGEKCPCDKQEGYKLDFARNAPE